MITISATGTIRNKSLFQNGRSRFQESAGTLDNFLLNAYDCVGSYYPKFYKMDRLSQLGFLASEMIAAATPFQHYDPYAVSVVLANASASLDTDARYMRAAETVPSPALFVYTLPNIVAGEICIRHGIKGENAFFVMHDFDPEWLVRYVNMALQPHTVQACLAGWVEVCNEHHDVFLYLAEKQERGIAIVHTAEQLNKLYQLEYGTIDGRS